MDGACHISKLVKRAKQLRMPAVAITDRNTLAGAYKFTKLCREAGIKPIIGTEIEVINDQTDSQSYNLILLVKNDLGFVNLSRLISLTYSYDSIKPQITKSQLALHADGLICLSFSVSGELGTYLLNDNKQKALDTIEWFKTVFSDGYYLEFQNLGLPQEAYVMPQVLNLARETKTPLVITNDCHYLHRNQSLSIDVLNCIRKSISIKSPESKRFLSNEYYFKSHQEMQKLLHCPRSAFDNTLKIAEQIDFDLISFLQRESSALRPEHCLDMAKQAASGLGFFALKDSGNINFYIPKGAKNELLSRLNESLMDCQIVGLPSYHRYSPQELLTITSKTFGLTEVEISQFIELMPQKSKSIIDAILKSVDFSCLTSENEVYYKITTQAMHLEGVIGKISSVAHQYVIAPQNTVLPITQKPSGDITLLVDGILSDEVSFPTITILEWDVINQIKEKVAGLKSSKGIEVDYDNLPLGNANIYQRISAGDTEGIFQLSSQSTRERVKQFKPANISELMAFMVLNTPSMNSRLNEYIRKRKTKQVYAHSVLQDVLSETYGMLLYHEQITALAQKLAGFSVIQAVHLRRALIKGNKAVKENLLNEFTCKGLEKGVPLSVLEDCIAIFQKHTKHIFSKAHTEILTTIAYLKICINHSDKHIL